jgi:hypothetical protein
VSVFRALLKRSQHKASVTFSYSKVNSQIIGYDNKSISANSTASDARLQ